MKTNTQVKLALALVALAGVAALLAWLGARGGQPLGAGERAARGRAQAAQPPAAVATKSPGERAAPAGEPSPAPGVHEAWFRGRLVADKQPVPGVAALAVFGVSETSGYTDAAVRGESDAGGRFELELAALLRDPPPRIEVRVDHPGYVPRAVQLALRDARVPDTTVIELKPAAVVSGIVLGPDGTASSGARVAIYAATDEAPGDSAAETATVDHRGRYRLRGASGGRYWVVAWERGRRPAARVEELTLRRVREVTPLRLRAGVAVSGRLLVNAAPAKAGATVRAGWEGEGRRVGNLVWNGGVVEHGEVQAAVGPGGEFRLDGLAPARYTVRSWGLGRRSHFSIHRCAAVAVEAPAAGVEIRLDTAHLRLEVRASGKPLPEARVMIHGDGSLMAHADGDGLYEIHVRPGLAYTIEVHSPGLAPHKSSVLLERAGTERTLRIDLGPKPPSATLVVRVRPVEGAPPAAIVAGLFPEGVTGPSPPVRKPATPTETPGVFRVKGLEPGAYRLIVRQGKGWYGSLGHLLDVEKAVVLRPDEVTRVEVAPGRGGRLRLAAVTPDGQRVKASCRLRDPDGKPFRSFFVKRVDGGFAGWTMGLFADGLTEVAAPLPPGRYTAEIRAEGYRPQTVELVIEARRTTEHEVRLER